MRYTAIRNIMTCLFILAILAAFTVSAQDQGQPKVLRVGFEKTKPTNNLDRYGSKNMYDIGAYSRIKPVYNMSMFSRVALKPAFNASQRAGTPSRFTYRTGMFKPFYNVSAYSRIKPIYEASSLSRTKRVYSIESYPSIKAVNAIP